MRLIWFGAAVMIVVGCASTPPTRLYTLDMTPTGLAKPECNIEVDHMRVHETLNRMDILILKSPTEVEYYASDDWAASLTELVSEKLKAEFGNPQEGRTTVLATGKVLAFGQNDTKEGPKGHVKIEMVYRTPEMDPYDPAIRKVTYETLLPVESDGPKGLVTTLTRGLEALARDMARDAEKVAKYVSQG
ncbi:MAG: hypothetical protein AMXMBFR84_22100 [Candidatus Hydrogenedentota bacterium]